jgi:hypothetical protein
MRAMLTAAVGLAACFALFGCDQNPQQAQTVAATPVAVAPPAPCNCRQTAAALAVRVAHHFTYHHRYGRYDHYRHHSHTLSEFLAYSTSSSSYSANETSSVREYRPGDEERYSQTDYAQMRETASENHRAMTADAGVWVDGFGKVHYADYGPLDDEHPGLIAGKDEHERQNPWRGYDSKCNNRIN